MGFLDKLQDIGIGNTGPYGRRTSGATNFANYTNQRAGVEGQRGVSQALALAAGEGKIVSFTQMSEIAEKWGPWGVTINQVMEQAKGLNQTVEAESIKQGIVSVMDHLGKMDPNERKALDGPALERIATKLNITNPAVMTAISARLHSMQGKTFTFPADHTVGTKSIGGKFTEDIPGVPKKTKEGMTKADLTHRANFGATPEIRTKAQTTLDALIAHDIKVAEARGKVTTATDRRIEGARETAKKELEGLKKTGTTPNFTKEMAQAATGPYANLKAFWDALGGGIGLDALIGKDGFFKTTQEARQTANTFKNSVLDAMRFSRMGAGYDLKRIGDMVPDPTKKFVNPANEANKINTLRTYIKTVKKSNLEGILTAASATEIDKLTNSNQKINTILAQIGENEATITDDDLMKLYKE